MGYLLEDKLVVGISGRALFDLSEEHEIFVKEGLESYRKLQKERETRPLNPGTGFPLVRGLLSINERLKQPAVEVVVISQNHGGSGLRLMNSIASHRLAITRASFCGGRNAYKYCEAYQCKLFLSAEKNDVGSVLEHGGAAALVFPMPEGFEHDIHEIRIAFDADAVIFSDAAEQIFTERGIEEFMKSEVDNARIPLEPGPFKPFLQSLAAIQSRFDPADCPIRTAVVTARNAPAHERAIRTLQSWGVAVDEMHFLGGIEKSGVLQVFKPHIFFDDQQSNVVSCAAKIPSAQVCYAERKKPSARVESVPRAASAETGNSTR